MGRKRTSGLLNRKGIWHIDKKILGQRICESTGSDSLEEAEIYLAKRIEEIRQAKIYGVRPERIFRQAAIKYLEENQHKASIWVDAIQLKILDKYIGHLSLEAIHMDSLKYYIHHRTRNKKNNPKELKKRTINYGLQVVRRILNLAEQEWKDEYGLSWLVKAPKIKLEAQTDARKPYPLSYEEQLRLFRELPIHLRRMALFAVNTGCRDQEICNLKWEWETKVPEGSIFLIPEWQVKNGEERLVVLNKIAHRVIEEVRGIHPEYVFTFRDKPISRMLNSAWKKARVRSSLAHVRVHDLKHTFGRRLRAAEVSFEDRQDLLGHKSGRITTHYSQSEYNNLIRAANKVCDIGNRLVILNRKEKLPAPAKVPQGNFKEVKADLKII
jgi:integrase